MSNRKKRGKYIVNAYSVIEFDEEESDERLFECIPDSWFVDETKRLCFWPPHCGTKSFSLRAINCEKPDDTWYVHECKVVSGGHATYASGFKIVKEKCSQKFNTSSAEDHIEAANYRRKHPVLCIQGERNFERVFSEKNSKNEMVNQNVGVGHEVHSEQRQENFTDVTENNGDASNDVGDSRSIQHEDNSNRLSKFTSDSNIEPVEGVLTDHLNSKPVPQASSRTKIQKSNQQQRNERRLVPKDLNSSFAININKQLSTQHKNKSLPHEDNGSLKRKRRSNSSSGSTQSSFRSRRSSSSRFRRSGSPRSRSRRSDLSRSRSGSRLTNLRFLKPASGSNPEREKRVRTDHSKSKSVGQLASSRTNKIQKSNQQQQNERRSSTKLYRNKNKSLSPEDNRPLGRKGCESSSDRRSISGNSHSSSRSSSAHSRRPISRCSSSRSRRSSSNYRRSQSHTSRSKSRTSRSQSNSRRLSSHLGRSESRISQSQSRPSLPQPRSFKQTFEDIESTLKRLIKFNKDFKQSQIEHEQRLNRIEVIVNKTFITVGDWTNTNNFQIQHNKRMSIESEAEMDEFEVPKLPILDLIELRTLNRELKNRRFRKFLINHQRHFCAPSKTATDTVTLTKYLQRFISLRVRCGPYIERKTKIRIYFNG